MIGQIRRDWPSASEVGPNDPAGDRALVSTGTAAELGCAPCSAAQQEGWGQRWWQPPSWTWRRLTSASCGLWLQRLDEGRAAQLTSIEIRCLLSELIPQSTRRFLSELVPESMRRFVTRQKGKFQIYWRVGRRELLLVSTVVLAISTFYMESHDWATLSFFLAAIGIALSFIEFQRVRKESTKYQLVETPNAVEEWRNFNLSSKYLGWKKYRGRHGVAWYDPKVNQIISEQPFTLSIEPSRRTLPRLFGRPNKFELPDNVRKYERFILSGQEPSAVLFNARKIRLSTDLTVDTLSRGQGVTIRPTTYYDSLCTNDMTPLMLQERNVSSVAICGIDVVSNKGILLDLSEPDLSNHVGGSTLAFTSDDYLVIQRQTKRSRQSAGRFAPSGSGSLDWKDVARADTLGDFVKTGLRRELVEETGLPCTTPVDPEILGVVRHAHRGGLIEFYGIARLPAEFRELRTHGAEHLYVFDRQRNKCQLHDPLLLAQQIRRIHDDLRKDSTADISFPLEVALHLLVEALTERPQLVARALGINQWKREDLESVPSEGSQGQG
jgi:hypothetical protein